MPDCPHVEPGCLACLGCRLATVDWKNHPCRGIVKMTFENFPSGELEEMEVTEIKTLDQLVAVYEAANTGKATLGNQGQALDGYSELANYRAILAQFLAAREGRQQ